jgi:hypothetical protein
MVDERIAARGDVHASVRRMGLQILCSKALSRTCALLANLVIWIERAWASVAADNLRSYVRDSDPKQYWDEGCRTRAYYGL